MKKKLIVFAIMATGCVAIAQEKKTEKIPAIVKDSFKKLYPDVSTAKWEIDEGNYEAEFKKGKEEWEIEFDASGNLIKSELESSVDKFPKAVQDVLKKDFATAKITEPEKVTLANGKTVYEVDAKMNGKTYELQLDEMGMIVSKIEEKETN